MASTMGRRSVGKATIRVTISLVSHNQRQDLERLLPSLLLAANIIHAEILLVDNCSTDGTVEWVRQHYPMVDVMLNSQRAGYGENHNFNLQRAQGNYLVIMNSDMTVEEDVFSVLEAYMEKHPSVGIVAPNILNPDGTVQGLNKRYPTVWDLFLRRCMPSRFRHYFRRRMDHYEMRDVGYDRECEVPFLSGAFMFCRMDVLKSVNGFDPGFFLYFEDADLCRRVQKTHRTMYMPSARVFHFWQRSAHKQLSFAWYFVCSAARYFWKWGLKLW